MQQKTDRRHGHRWAAAALLSLSLALPLTAGTAHAGPSATPTSSPTATPTKAVDPLDQVLRKRGDSGKLVRNLKARLVQRKLLKLPFNGTYDRATVKAVKTLQSRRKLKVTGKLDRRTWNRLVATTKTPTKKQLSGKKPVPPRIPGSYRNRLGKLDKRCLTGSVICIDKSSRTLQWVVNGKARLGLDVRFGGSATPTREGTFSVYRKSRHHVSSIYHTSMPLAMFFDGGQAVHYSPDFAAKGYSGASHGCVNVRDFKALEGLFDRTPIGTKVVVYWS